MGQGEKCGSPRQHSVGRGDFYSSPGRSYTRPNLVDVEKTIKRPRQMVQF